MNNNLTVFSTDVIPVYTTDIGEQVVIGRELHERLEIGQDYSSWFKRMCESWDLEEGSYYSLNLGNNTGKRGKPRKDHILTLDTAKEIAMVQQSDMGKAIRKKLIEIEKKFREQTQQSSSVDFRSILDSESNLKLLAETALALVEEKEKTRTLMLECEAKDEKISVLEPKAERCEKILQSDELLTATKIAKEYGYSAQKFNQLLYGFGIQYWQSDQWVLYAKYQNQGYTAPYDYHYYHSNGSSGTRQQTRWTQKGRQFLYDFLKEREIVPLIEREERGIVPLIEREK